MSLLTKLTTNIALNTGLTLASVGVGHVTYSGLSSLSSYAQNKYLLWNQTPALKIKPPVESNEPERSFNF